MDVRHSVFQDMGWLIVFSQLSAEQRIVLQVPSRQPLE